MDGESWEIRGLTNYEVAELKKALNRKTEQVKRFKKGREYARLEKRNAELREELVKARQRIDWYSDKVHVQDSLYYSLSQKYVKLDRKFEANFKFHEYIRDVLDRTADLMENYDAVREQGKAVQERIQTAGRKGRTRRPDGAATRTS
jgi:FtsZ-binding cell division protein ZapB